MLFQSVWILQLISFGGIHCSYYGQHQISGDRNDVLPDKVFDATKKSECGRMKISQKNRRLGRIVNGFDASMGEFPWQVLIKYFDSDILGGGALINRRWVISAAHNFYGDSTWNYYVRLGEFNIGHDKEPLKHVDRNISDIISHSQYDESSFEYDAALLKMIEPVEFRANVQPICLYSQDNSLEGRRVYATGWGVLFENDRNPHVLQKVALPIIKNKICEKLFQTVDEETELSNLFLCAGFRHGKYDTCSGDSGGPLQMRLSNGRWALVGIISWGYGCAQHSRPGLYTRVSEIIPWIKKTINNN